MQPQQSKSADINLHDIALMYSWGDSQSSIAKTLRLSKTTVNMALKPKNLCDKLQESHSENDFLTYINQSLQNDKKKLRNIIIVQFIGILIITTSVIYAIL